MWPDFRDKEMERRQIRHRTTCYCISFRPCGMQVKLSRMVNFAGNSPLSQMPRHCKHTVYKTHISIWHPTSKLSRFWQILGTPYRRAQTLKWQLILSCLSHFNSYMFQLHTLIRLKFKVGIKKGLTSDSLFYGMWLSQYYQLRHNHKALKHDLYPPVS